MSAPATAAELTPRIQAGTRAMRTARAFRDQYRQEARAHVAKAVRLPADTADAERRLALGLLREASRWERAAQGVFEDMEEAGE